MTLRVVTISASFGSGGSVIGPAVAERLGIPFVDRAIPAAVARDLAVPLDRALAHDQKLPTGIVRVLSKMANAVIPIGTSPIVGLTETDSEDIFRSGTEKVIHQVADQTGGVILGRAGAIVLAAHPTALHVRLHGPRERRLRRSLGRPELTEEEARRLLDDSDKARIAYVKHFYKRDPQDSRLYHLVIDTTALSDDIAIELIALAARARAGS